MDVVADGIGAWFLEILVLVGPCTVVLIFVQGMIDAKKEENKKRATSTEEKRGSVLLPSAKVPAVMLAK